MGGRVLAGACFVTLLVLGGTARDQQRPADASHPRLAQLVEEFLQRSEPRPGDPAGPLVPDRARLLSESVALADARWASSVLQRLEELDPEALDHDDWVTWSLLRWDATLAAKRGEFFWYEAPITPYASPLRPISTAFAAASLETPDQRQRYLDGLRQLPVLAAAMEAKLRGQADRGIVLPRPGIDPLIPYLLSFAAAPDVSPFGLHGPRVDTLPDAERDAFGQQVREIVARQVSPAFQRLAAYVEGEYRARAPQEVGVSRYPGGLPYYQFLVKLHTGLEHTPEEIHEIGLAEVARLQRELDEVRAQTGYRGTLAEFRTFLKTDSRFFPRKAEEMGDRLMEAANRIEPKLADWFIERPKAPYGVRRLPAALEPVMTYGYYQRPTAIDPKGYYLYNGSRLDERSMLFAAALSYHELVPGHHFQFVLVQESTRLGPFRQRAAYTAYSEGWGEYASDLAGEMGMYVDPYDRAGRLAMDLFLTTRLVVDTGMNALGWSRERAMQYMREHTLESEAQIQSETLRYSTDIPAQALAYKMGSRGIRQLRDRMETELGERFDVRRFHQAVLGHGPMPLAVLERHVERMLQAD